MYHSPTPSVPVLPLTPALQPSLARSMVDAPIKEAPRPEQTASAPVTQRESRAAVQSHAPGSEEVRAPLLALGALQMLKGRFLLQAMALCIWKFWAQQLFSDTYCFSV